MPDRKLTDSEIKKALECCSKGVHAEVCEKCAFRNEDNKININCFYLEKYALDLINRLQEEKEALINGQETLQKYIAEQKAEIERLKEEVANMDKAYFDVRTRLETAKAEAYKECIEKAKSEIDSQSHSRSLEASGERFRIHKILDNLLKEMVGEDNAEMQALQENEK